MFSHNGQFDWDTTGMSVNEIAVEFLKRYPKIAKQSLGSDPDYVGWFKLALNEARQGHFFSIFREHYPGIPADAKIHCGSGHFIPFPPPGTATEQHLY